MGVHDADAYPKVKEALGIPEDEPIFILRAQDRLSTPVIARYGVMARQIEDGPPSEEWHEHIAAILREFTLWQHDNKTKVPD